VGEEGDTMMRFTRENTPGADDEDLAEMEKRYDAVVSTVGPRGIEPFFLHNLAEVIREEVMIQKRMAEAFEAYKRKDGEDGE
jgi:hypothetical protein